MKPNLERLPGDPTREEILRACELIRRDWPRKRLLKNERPERPQIPVVKTAELRMAVSWTL
jgi:hypothetical protein